MTLAFELGKFPYELEELSIEEYDRLIIYSIWKNREDEKAIKKNKKRK